MSKKVLVVEDDGAAMESLRDVLKSLGLEVLPTMDGEFATHLIGKVHFDGIFVDLFMPKVDGFELTRRIRNSHSNHNTPVFVVSGSGDLKTMQKAFDAGAAFFVPKPIDRRKLLGVLNLARGAMELERRSEPRAVLRTDVECQTDARPVRGMSVDVSEHGMQIETGSRVTEGKVLAINFKLPSSKALMHVVGVVEHVGTRRLGVRFVEIAERDRIKVREYVSAQQGIS